MEYTSLASLCAVAVMALDAPSRALCRRMYPPKALFDLIKEKAAMRKAM
ncbi:hypothetical protein JN12_03198, partial [Geobacter argillaceus]